MFITVMCYMLYVVYMPVQDLELALDSERRGAEDARQAATLLERKRIALQTELEDLRAMLDAVSSLSFYLCLCFLCPDPTCELSDVFI